MNEYLNKQYHKGIILFWVVQAFLVGFVLSFIGMVSGYLEYPVSIFVFLAFSIGLMACGIWYLASFYDLQKCLRWLQKKDLTNIANDISLEQPTLSASKIYCGRHAFFVKKNRLLLPYKEIAWAYIRVKQAYGVTLEKLLMFHTTDGKVFSAYVRDEDVVHLLSNYIAPNSPDMVLGFGSAERKQYLRRNPAAMKKHKRSNIWTGVAILLFGAIFLSGMLMRDGFADIPGVLLIFTAGIILTGSIFLILGLKKEKI